MTTFDRVIPELLVICEAEPGFAAVTRACIVRDLKARVRLVLELADAAALASSAPRELLEDRLKKALDGYFVPPIITTAGPVEEKRLSTAILTMGKPHASAASGANPPKGGWFVVERRLSRSSWLEAPSEEAVWPRSMNLPVVAFYSFKGGVGRTTALMSCAWQLAQEGKRVAVVDLDLEAPGLGSLLGVSPGRGVLDLVVDHLATGKVDLTDAYGPALGFGDEAGARVDVFPAGSLGDAFLEKLARLDYAASNPWGKDEESHVEAALRQILTTIKKTLKPDFVLLDARSGLHDLSGLSLNALAHIDVLFGRPSAQAFEGLRLAASVLAKRKNLGDRPPIVVHALVDPAAEARNAEVQDYKQNVYDLFLKHVYPETQDAPELENDQSLHYPCPLERIEALARPFSDPRDVKEHLFASGYVALKKRIEELATPSTDPSDVEESS